MSSGTLLQCLYSSSTLLSNLLLDICIKVLRPMGTLPIHNYTNNIILEVALKLILHPYATFYLQLTMNSIGLSLKMVPMIPATQIRVVMTPAVMSRAPPEIIVLPVTKEKLSFSLINQPPTPMTVKAMACKDKLTID